MRGRRRLSRSPCHNGRAKNRRGSKHTHNTEGHAHTNKDPLPVDHTTGLSETWSERDVNSCLSQARARSTIPTNRAPTRTHLGLCVSLRRSQERRAAVTCQSDTYYHAYYGPEGTGLEAPPHATSHACDPPALHVLTLAGVSHRPRNARPQGETTRPCFIA